MYKQFLSLIAVAVTGSVLFSSVAFAATSSSANFSKSYYSSEPISAGSIVSLKQGHADTVELANATNVGRMVGVAVAEKDSLLAVDSEKDKIQVATSGSVVVYASTIGGAIKIGDQISASPLNGVGMKLSGSRVLGIAQSALNDSTSGAQKQTIKDKNDKSTDVSVAKIRISIAIGSGTSGAQTLNQLQRLVKSLTGKSIPTLRIVISLAVAALAIIAMIVLTYSSIYGALISIGRNPLARDAITRALVYVAAMVVGVGVVAGILIAALLA